MKTMTLIIACIVATLSAGAQISITASSLTYTQDFNMLDTSGSTLTTMPPGWSFYEWGGSSANAAYRASTGSSTTGDTYSFGFAGSTERSLGSLCSGGVPNVSYGARFVNNTGAYINAVNITYKAEQWRRNGSGNTDSVRFYYSTAPGKTIADTSLSSWIQARALLMISVTTAMPASATNGNDTARVIAAFIPVALAAGDTMSIRWYDYNAAGNDDALSIDSLTMTFNIGPPSGSYKPAIIGLSPAPSTANVPAATNLVITFDKNIAKGASGNIYVKDRKAQTTQIIATASGNVSVSGKVATISGVGLLQGRTYHVTFDSTAFDSAGFCSYGLYDTSSWQFATVTVGIPEIRFRALVFTVANPASGGVFALRCALPQDALLTATIYDAAGRNMIRHICNASKGDNLFLIPSTLPPGNYIIHLSDGRRWGSATVVLQ